MRPFPVRVAEVFERADPAAEALVTRSGRWTYAELDRHANRAAHALATLGVRPGDRVAATLPNDMEIVAAFHGAMRVGAIWVGINRALAAPEKDYLLTDSDPALWLSDDAVSAEVRTVLVGPGQEWASLVHAADEVRFPYLADPYAPAGIAYTSGTTGYPKGAVHSQYNLLVPGAVLTATRGYGPALRKGDCFPLTILNMQVLTTLLCAQAGGCSILMDRIDAAGVAEWAERERVTVWNGPPPVIYSLAHDDAIDASALASLEEVWTGGADCPETLRDAFAAKFGRPVTTTYGLSEAPTVVSIDDRDGSHPAGTSGRALPHLAVSVEDGEICVGPRAEGEWASVYRPVLGYWRRDTTPVVDGVLHTGDLGSVSEDGFVTITDRKNLVILRGGANVYPAEVERVINGCDGVVASAVIGLADERLGQRVVAVVEGPVDVEALLERCRAELAKYKVPERVVVVDALPRNSMGKVQRAQLPDLF